MQDFSSEQKFNRYKKFLEDNDILFTPKAYRLLGDTYRLADRHPNERANELWATELEYVLDGLGAN